MKPPRSINDVAGAMAEGSMAFLSGVGVAGQALRAVAREAIRPELQELGIDHIEPFNAAGRLRLQRARNARAAEQRRARAEDLDRLWDEHDRSIAMPLAERYPELLTDDTSRDPPGTMRGRYLPLESRPDTPADLLAAHPEATPKQIEDYRKSVARGEEKRRRRTATDHWNREGVGGEE